MEIIYIYFCYFLFDVIFWFFKIAKIFLKKLIFNVSKIIKEKSSFAIPSSFYL